MPRTLIAICIVLGLIVTALTACGGDDDAGSGSPTSSGDTLVTPSTKPTGGGQATASPAKETPPAGGSQTPNPGGGSGVPTAPPAASEGTPAVQPEDADEFLATFAGKSVDYQPCAYNPTTALTNCAGLGVYAIDPPITGQDINCTLLVVEAVPTAIQCQSAEPPQTRYYEVKG